MCDPSTCQGWYNCKAQQAEFITDFYNELRAVNKKGAPAFIQTPLKEQWAGSKTTTFLSLQRDCYVSLEFGKYYVSEQLRIPRSFIFMAFFLEMKNLFRVKEHCLGLSVVYGPCLCNPVVSFQLILQRIHDIPPDSLYVLSSASTFLFQCM